MDIARLMDTIILMDTIMSYIREREIGGKHGVLAVYEAYHCGIKMISSAHRGDA